MIVQRVALGTIALALVTAECIAPTHWANKRTSHETQSAIAASGMDESVLDGLPPIDELALGSIDFIDYDSGDGKLVPVNANVAVPHDANIVLIGWCADPQAREPRAVHF